MNKDSKRFRSSRPIWLRKLRRAESDLSCPREGVSECGQGNPSHLNKTVTSGAVGIPAVTVALMRDSIKDQKDPERLAKLSSQSFDRTREEAALQAAGRHTTHRRQRFTNKIARYNQHACIILSKCPSIR
ncbi:hypothetical protein EV363DRAFT_1151235 [Boletus edulis]|uniref:Uncharacterized protein n=1 Tax=Boletus edulis BED1 TaxID=1328754 RepID=A0AAD4C5H1_BOLED|nr:hypothetical protein EV363DRAFT_1151235 [Boletus edulis]KAF8449336.1 hypothetical protein L210DRAFT_389203 [Boletus edulis BED1]